jgi:hypothetical protein
MPPISNPRTSLALLCSLIVAIVSGCGSDEPPTGTVSGEVTLDGAPLPAGNIQFRPMAGDVGTGGTEIKDGKFEAVVPVGKMRVEITANKVVGKRKAYDSPESPVVDVVEELIPQRYNVTSELSTDVKEGGQTVRYDLKSK